MHITKVYTFIENDIKKTSASLPEGIEPISVMDILEADDGMILRKKGTREETPNVWIHDDIKQDDYEEIKMEVEDDRTTDVA